MADNRILGSCNFVFGFLKFNRDFLPKFYAMDLAGPNFFLEKMGNQTEECERDEESGIRRIDRVL